jgi:hypothetical protein
VPARAIPLAPADTSNCLDELLLPVHALKLGIASHCLRLRVLDVVIHLFFNLLDLLIDLINLLLTLLCLGCLLLKS